jgi:ActR/RegA family two-component response regulator
MNNGAHVLVVSRDQMLLQTRALMLGTYFQVEAAGRVPEAEEAMRKRAFDLVVLCYSLSDDEYRKMLDLCLSQDSPPKVLTLHGANNGRPRDGGDGEYAVERGPYELLKKTAEMVGFPLKPMGRQAQTQAQS